MTTPAAELKEMLFKSTLKLLTLDRLWKRIVIHYKRVSGSVSTASNISRRTTRVTQN